MLMLNIRLAYLKLQSLFLKIQLFLELSSLRLLLCHELFIIILILLQWKSLLLARIKMDLFLSFNVAMRLPCRVDDLAAH